MLHRVEIQFLLALSFELLSERNEPFGSLEGRANDKVAISLRTARQILSKTKDFFESLKYYLTM